MKRILFVALLCAPLAIACGDDSDGSTVDDTTDAGATETDTGGTGSDAAVEEDVPTVGDIGNPDEDTGAEDRCDPADLIEAYPLNDAISNGAVSASDDAGVFTAEIDASAGGSEASANNPFVYISLDRGDKEELTDIESLGDANWTLAFRRTIVRVNSADSGPGQVSLGRLTGTTFDAVTDVPDGTRFEEDETYSADCLVQTDPIFQPITAINLLNGDNASGSGSWYTYGGGGGGGVSPTEGDIYIVRDGAAGVDYKFEILSWDGGVYEVRWAEL